MQRPGTIGRFKIRATLGRGGAGVVYRATDPRLRRDVAIKMLLPTRTGRAALKRFDREARVLAKVRHPNVVSVHEIGEEDGNPYIVMDLAEGETLQTRIDRDGPLPPAEAARLTERLARALDAAHAHQVLHRDLKPENVIVTLAGDPMLTDFGLAKDLDDPDVSGSGMISIRGRFMGTPGFAAPEQAKGADELGPAADIYGLGATLCVMLTGEPPVIGSTLVEMVIATTSGRVRRPSEMRPELEVDEIDDLCMRCLQVEAGSRFRSARELAEALERYLRGDSSDEWEARRARRATRKVSGRAPKRTTTGRRTMTSTRTSLGAAPGRSSGVPVWVGLAAAGAVLLVAIAFLGSQLAAERGSHAETIARLEARLAAAEEGEEGEEGDARPEEPFEEDAEPPSVVAGRDSESGSGGGIAGADREEANEAARAPEEPAPRADPDAVHAVPPSNDGPVGRSENPRVIARIRHYGDPSNPGNARAQGLVSIAVRQINGGDFAAARKSLDEAVGLDPTIYFARYNRGFVRMKLGDLPGAIEDLDAAIAIVPEADAFAYRGEAKLSSGDLAGALADFNEASERKPNVANTWLMRGVVRSRAGDIDGAIADLQEWCRLSPGSPELPKVRAEINRLRVVSGR